MLPSKQIQSLSNPIQSKQEKVAAEILGSFSKNTRCHNDKEFRMAVMPKEQGLLPPHIGFSSAADAGVTFKMLGVGSVPNRATESDTHLSSFNSQHSQKILLSPGQQQEENKQEQQQQEEQNEFVDETGYIINSNTKSILSQSVKLMNRKFPVKLMMLLEDNSYSSIVSWTHGGSMFTIYKPNEFTKYVLPQCFKQSKFQSFLRKMYRWGFSKRMESSIAIQGSPTFSHPQFIRGNFHLCNQITCSKGKTIDDAVSFVQTKRISTKDAGAKGRHSASVPTHTISFTDNLIHSRGPDRQEIIMGENSQRQVPFSMYTDHFNPSFQNKMLYSSGISSAGVYCQQKPMGESTFENMMMNKQWANNTNQVNLYDARYLLNGVSATRAVSSGAVGTLPDRFRSMPQIGNVQVNQNHAIKNTATRIASTSDAYSNLLRHGFSRSFYQQPLIAIPTPTGAYGTLQSAPKIDHAGDHYSNAGQTARHFASSITSSSSVLKSGPLADTRTATVNSSRSPLSSYSLSGSSEPSLHAFRTHSQQQDSAKSSKDRTSK